MAKYVSSDGLTYYNSKIKSLINGKANANHTHNYAGSGSAGGSANSAVKLDTATSGSATQPVYFTGGKPVACTYTVAKSVPANAVFTDTWDKVKCTGDTGGRPAFFNPYGEATKATGTAAYLALWDYATDNSYATLKYMAVGDISNYHTHKYAGSSSAGGAANSVANSLSIQLNGGTATTFNGSAARSINITPAGIGAATSGHKHSTLVDANDSSRTCAMAYSAKEKAYGEYTYLAVWDGSTLKSAPKTQFATSGHTHGTLVDPVKSGSNTTNYVSLSYYSAERTIGGDNDFSYLAAWSKSGNMISTISRDKFLQASRVYHTLSTTYADYVNMPTQLPTIGTLASWNGAYASNGSSVLAYCNQGAFSNGATTHISYGTTEPSTTGAKNGDIYILYSA